MPQNPNTPLGIFGVSPTESSAHRPGLSSCIPSFYVNPLHISFCHGRSLAFHRICICSAVRRSFLARSNSESPATVASLRAGRHGPGAQDTASTDTAAAEAAVAEYEVSASSGRQGAPLGVSTWTKVKTEGGHQTASASGLLRMVLHADEVDLPCLSLVLHTALSILFARSAVINLLSHVGGCTWFSVNERCRRLPVPRQFYARRAHYACPWSWSQLRTMNEHDGSIDAGQTISSSTYIYHPLVSDTLDRAMSSSLKVQVERGVLEMLADVECQRRIVDLTKVLIGW